MAEHSSPKPIDPIRYHLTGKLRIECGCGRIVIGSLQDFASKHRLDGNVRLHDVIARLRCRTCGNRPRFAEVTKRARDFGEAHFGTGRTERALWPRSRDH